MKGVIICLVLVALGTLVATVGSTEFPKLVTKNTTLGSLVGIENRFKETRYCKFLGIPYATAERFENPMPYGSFLDNPLNATAYGPQCAQGNGIGSEDCHTLNIIVPKRGQGLKSVMIYIYGGSFQFGAADYYPFDIFAATNDVVVVTFNYRISAFGFLASPSNGLTGNYGLWDQRLAIQWVKDNIIEYGGDPDSITLFGESAGANSITIHMVSPSTPSGLFHRVILQSGSTFALRFQTFPQEFNFQVISGALGCSGAVDLKACLKGVPMPTLAAIADQLPYYPTIDEIFLTSNLTQRLAEFSQRSYVKPSELGLGNFADYDVLSGWNTMEGLYFTPLLFYNNLILENKTVDDGVSENVLEKTFNDAARGSFAPVGEQITKLAVSHYMNNPHPMVSDGRSVEDRRVEVFVDMLGDIAMKIPAITHLQMHSFMTGGNTYAYEYTYKQPGPGYFGVEQPEWLRVAAAHGDELFMLLGAPIAPPDMCTPELGSRCGNYDINEKKLSRRMMRTWSKFAKTGNPRTGFTPFEYPGKQAYTVIGLTCNSNANYPRSVEHRFSAILDLVWLQSQVIV